MFKLYGVKYRNIIDIELLEIPKNKMVIINGKSGSGKSTLLKLLNNIISPTEGEVLYKEKDIESIDPIELRRNVSMIPQFPIIFDGDVKVNLIAGLSLSKRDLPSEVLMKKQLNLINLNKNLHSEVTKLSGGEKQRLSIARIMLMKPDIMLLDEPVASLDKENADYIVSILKNQMVESGTSVIMVNHNDDITDKYADGIIRLDAGRVDKVEWNS